MKITNLKKRTYKKGNIVYYEVIVNNTELFKSNIVLTNSELKKAHQSIPSIEQAKWIGARNILPSIQIKILKKGYCN